LPTAAALGGCRVFAHGVQRRDQHALGGAVRAPAGAGNKPATVSGAVATTLRDVAEQVAAEATASGRPAVACTGDERECAQTFIDRFASRAFQAPLATSWPTSWRGSCATTARRPPTAHVWSSIAERFGVALDAFDTEHTEAFF
jgi:hypothetical protein